MTVFNVESEEQGDWYAFFTSRVDPSSGEIEYDKPEKGAAEFRIRSMVPFWEERRKNRKREYKMVLNPATRSMERVRYYEDLSAEEEKKESEDAWDYVITGMKNAFSAPGIVMECIRENKLKLIKMPVFMRFLNRVFSIMTEVGIKEKEEKEKN